MWKNIPRRCPFERGPNFDKRGPSGVVNATLNNSDEKNKRPSPACGWFKAHGCLGSNDSGSNTNNNRWNFQHITSSWIGAITWSGALVFGWYTSQLCQLKQKYYEKKYDPKHHSNLLSSLHPYLCSVNKNPTYLKSILQVEKIVNHFTPTVHLISNEHSGIKKEKSVSASSSSTPDSSDDALGDVLNSIENKLGLAAIENGQLEDGLKLLRSAAHRSYAPALYNLGICYEMGLGVVLDEKTAMELYRSAAALEHPGALYNLGVFYGQGRGGLNRDTTTATRLLKLAAVQGQEEAISALKSLEVDNEPLKKTEIPSWSQLLQPQFPLNTMHDVPPTFLENVNCIQSQKATVY